MKDMAGMEDTTGVADMTGAETTMIGIRSEAGEGNGHSTLPFMS